MANSRRLAVVADDLARRLTAIEAMTKLLVATPLDAQQARYVRNIEASTDRLLTIATAMTDLVQIERGALTFGCEAFDLRELVEETVTALADVASARGLDLICCMPPEVPTGVCGDAGRLRQILRSLVESVIETTNGCQIDVRVGLPAVRNGVWRYRFEIEDSMPGLVAGAAGPEAGVATSSDRPWRRNDSVELIIAEIMVSAMGGEAGVDGVAGRGMLTWFVVPLGQGPAKDVGDRIPLDGLRGVRVAIVDGNLHRRHVVWLYLAGLGLDPVCHGTVVAALDAESGAHCSARVLIVDEGLGATEIARLRRGLAGIGRAGAPALILLTAAPVRVASGGAMGVEATGQISKPVTLIPLALAVANALGVRAAEPAASLESPSPPGRTLRVLLAEDNPVNQQVAVDMLEGLGCRVALAHDGVEALGAIAREPFDLILMDCLMPRVDGFDATRAIRRREAESGEPRRTVIALTALSMEGDRERCLEAGMDDFVTKPFRRREMLEVLERWRGRIQNDERIGNPDRSSAQD